MKATLLKFNTPELPMKIYRPTTATTFTRPRITRRCATTPPNWAARTMSSTTAMRAQSVALRRITSRNRPDAGALGVAAFRDVDWTRVIKRAPASPGRGTGPADGRAERGSQRQTGKPRETAADPRAATPVAA